MRILLIIASLCLSSHETFAVENTSLVFVPTFQGRAIQLFDSSYILNKKDTIRFTSIKWYISNIQLLDDNRIIWSDKGNVHLFDFDSNKIPLIEIPTKRNCTTIRFGLGVDSLVNVSGALGGDLDPTKGMYWTWQSGYINLKLEGTSSSIKSSKKEFQYHIGGYSFPYNMYRTITLPMVMSDKIIIHFEIDKILQASDITTLHHIMSPNNNAQTFADSLLLSFSIKQ